MKKIMDAGHNEQQKPERKIKQPPTLEMLAERLAKLKHEQSYAFEEYRKAQETLQDLHKNIEQVETQIANMKYKEVPAHEIDWKDLLMANTGQGRYDLMHKKWHEMWPHGGLGPNNYIPETGQYTLCFHLDKKTCTDEYLKAMEKVLHFMIPFLIPHEGLINFSITEPGLSEYTSYDIKYYPDTKIWSLLEGRRNKKESFGSNNTLTFLKYLAARHAFNYSGNDEEDED